MKIRRILICLLSMLMAGSVEAQVANYDVVPLPKSINLLKAPGFVLNEQTVIVYTTADADMERNAHFLAGYIAEMTQLRLASQPYIKKKDARSNIVLTLNANLANEEGYTINVAAKGVTICGKTPAGVFRAIQTFRKSLPTLTEKPEAVSLPAVSIADEPRFAYRGMHLDCSRHFFPLPVVKEYIDMIALHGMNKFHWHISDDQGWRIEIKQYPKLTSVGAWRSGTVLGHNAPLDDGIRHGGFYSQEEAREIVRYAADRYITVIPEIDMPGHMLAALAAYPELGCTGGPYEVEHTWGIFPDVLCPGKDATFQFVENVLDEITQIFPSEYIHIGGDECPRTRWKECPFCQKRIQEEEIKAEGKKSKEDLLQGYFTMRIQKYLSGKGKKIIGWDELLDCNVDTTATIMSWTGAEPGAKGAKLGHDVIMTPTSHFYFDYCQSENKWGEPVCIGGLSTVENVYGFEPVAQELTKEESKHIWGVQANLWSEYIAYPTHMQYQVLPRMAALAEVQWLAPEQKDFSAFKERVTRLKEIYLLHHWSVANHLWKEK